jgi:acyl-CoA dehydrogenase
MLLFEDCRVPLDHLLGSAEVTPEGGFKDVMATFDATRPIVAAMAIGVGRAAVDFVRDFLQGRDVPIRYGISPRRLSAVERDFMEMEVQLKAARLLTWRAAWMLDAGLRNSQEASMAKAKAGERSHSSLRRRSSCSGRSVTRARNWSKNGCATQKLMTSLKVPNRSI